MGFGNDGGVTDPHLDPDRPDGDGDEQADPGGDSDVEPDPARSPGDPYDDDDDG